MTALAWRGDPAEIVSGSDPDSVGEWMLQLVEVGRPGWHVDAACVGVPTEVFFPARGASPGEAYEVCGRCPVQSDCLAEALADPDLDHGVRGGLSPMARKKLRRSTRLGPQGGSDHCDLGDPAVTAPSGVSLSPESGRPLSPPEQDGASADEWPEAS